MRLGTGRRGADDRQPEGHTMTELLSSDRARPEVATSRPSANDLDEVRDILKSSRNRLLSCG
jgi:hypothetical protein